MKRANGTLLVFICLLGLVFWAGATAAKVDSHQLKSFYDRMQNQRDVVLSGDLSADQQILLAMLISYGQSPSPELQKELPELYHQALKAGTVYLLMSDTDYTWGDTAWVGDQRTTHEYNAQDKDTSIVTEKWDEVGVDWVNYSRNLTTYDGNGRLSTQTSQDWDTLSSAWVNSAMTTYTYDESGRLSTLTFQDWDTAWVNSIMMTYTYDGNGRMSTAVFQMWEPGTPGSWVNYSKTITTYTAESRLDTIVAQNWDTLTVDWVNSTKFAYTYDLGGNMTEWLNQTWKTDHWVNAMRITSTFIADLETESVTQDWDTLAVDWVNLYKSTYTYDGSGNETIHLSEMWSGAAWLPTNADTLKYTGGENTETVHYNFLSTALSKDEYLYDANGNRIKEENSNWVDPDWVNVSKSVWVYEAALAVPISHENIPKTFELSQNFPNPFNPTTIINFSLERRSQVEISIYNLLGEKIRTIENAQFAPGVYQTFWDGADFSGHKAASGIYFYRIKAGDFTQTRKMILMK